MSEINDIKEELINRAKSTNNEEAIAETENGMSLRVIENILNIFKGEEIVKLLKELEDNGMDPKIIGTLMTIASLIAANATFDAISLYDEIMTNELTTEFNRLAEHINNVNADVNGIRGACEVFKTKIGHLENKLKLKK